ncbi:MAG: hypothetical protein PHC61_06315 [Chitinivibrionales bacterium]|nr:hypothetical protein [Chitinivibrionales bacterium]
MVHPLLLKTIAPPRHWRFGALLLFLVWRAGALPCQALLDSGDASYARFNSRAALAYFTDAYRACPARYETLMKITRACIDAGEDGDDQAALDLYRTGMRYADTLRQRFPDSSQAYFLNAVAAGNMSRLTHGKDKLELGRSAGQNARRAIALAPGFAPAYIVLGIYFREVATASALQKVMGKIFFGWEPDGTLEDSERTLRKALELSPCNNGALLEYARTLLAMGKEKEAGDYLQKVQPCPLVWHLDKDLKEESRHLLKNLGR